MAYLAVVGTPYCQVEEIVVESLRRQVRDWAWEGHLVEGRERACHWGRRLEVLGMAGRACHGVALVNMSVRQRYRSRGEGGNSKRTSAIRWKGWAHAWSACD